MKYHALAFCAGIALISVPNAASAAGPVACTTLATNPSLIGYAGFKSATAVITPIGVGVTVPYCLVTVVYGNSAAENINVFIGLPLNSVDGGTGGTVQGAWSGRTQGNGGGGCSTGSATGVRAATNKNWVGSASDGGHGSANNNPDSSCEPGVNADGSYNNLYIDDFIRVGVKQAILESKLLSNIYYGQAPLFNYWSGCSTGGRQGYMLAQELGNELDGIMANAPAMYWTRFQTAQMWGQVAMKDAAGEPANGIIPTARQNYATSLALAACDGNDGVLDGVVDDPRTCLYSAANDPSAICVANGGTSIDPNCLTPAEAAVMDKIWDGPRSSNGNKIWFHSDPGSGTTVWNGTNLFALAPVQWHWDEKNRNFDWHTVTMFGAGGTKSYSNVAQDGSTAVFLHGGFSLADETDTFGNFDTFKAHGGKVMTFVGTYDNLIMHRGVLNYYRQMASRYGGFAAMQNFYQLYRAPGAGHCGVGGADLTNFFNALVNWVENGVAPSGLTVTVGNTSGGPSSRPFCKYPQIAIYNGSGDTHSAANFTCGGNLETAQTVCKDVLVKYKGENAGVLDYTGYNVPGSVTVNSAVCSAFAGQKFFNAVP